MGKESVCYRGTGEVGCQMTGGDGWQATEVVVGGMLNDGSEC
jgi:hypothetical protein